MRRKFYCRRFCLTAIISNVNPFPFIRIELRVFNLVAIAKRPAVSNLVSIFAAFAGISPQKVVKKFEGKRYVDFKKELATLLIEKLKPIQKKRAELMKNKKKVMKIMEDGAEKARPIAEKTLNEAKKKIGLI